jgi:hypothetical protein
MREAVNAITMPNDALDDPCSSRASGLQVTNKDHALQPGLITAQGTAHADHASNDALAVMRRIHLGPDAPRTSAALCANSPGMTKMQTVREPGFTTPERAYIRGELDMFLSTLPTVAEGFQLKTWRGGPEAGKPKLSPVAKGLMDRGLMRLDMGERWPRLVFTEAGLAELRTMMRDRRFADPKTFAHIRQELGIDPMPETETPGT